MKNSIFGRMTRNTWKNDKFGAVCFSAFTGISVMLFALSVLLFTNLSGAIDYLMFSAKTPDFLQMHSGKLNEDELIRFADTRSDIRDFQICNFLNLENGVLYLGEAALSDSTQDNGLCVQGKGFDMLLDLNNNIPDVNQGEVYVPVCYQKQYDVEPGEEMFIGNEVLKVAGFIRDSQMNSMMASSKRFLVCEEDYERLLQLGTEEYLIEYLLTDEANINEFKTAYENAGLPMNGPTITKPLIKMMNALSDGIMIFIILLVSFLVLLISLICIRYMLLTRLEAERNEIGLLKAVGISGKDIRTMLLKRYLSLSVAGSTAGFAISLCLYQPMSAQMQRLYGVSKSLVLPMVISTAGVLLLTLAILAFVMLLLKKTNRMTAVQALTGRDEVKKRRSGKICITIATILMVFLMVIPVNLFSTMSSEKFVSYMGIGNGQLRIDIRQTENIHAITTGLVDCLEKDREVERFAVYQTMSIPAQTENRESMNFPVEFGNHEAFPVTYSVGKAPREEGEIAVSYLLAKEIGVSVGEQVALSVAGDFRSCTVTGIYSDITNGGKTVKMAGDGVMNCDNIMWSIAYVTLRPGTNAGEWMEQYQAAGVKVTDIKAFVQGTYGQTLSQIRAVAILAKAVAASVLILVIALFLKMLIEKDRKDISMKKALGFTWSDIRAEYISDSLKHLLFGTVIGLFAGKFAGEQICSVALRAFGADGFRFISDYSEICFVIPGLVALVGCTAVLLGTKDVRNIKAIECLRGKE